MKKTLPLVLFVVVLIGLMASGDSTGVKKPFRTAAQSHVATEKGHARARSAITYAMPNYA